MALGVAATAGCLLFAASPATANGVTFPVAEGVSGPYEYPVGIGPFDGDSIATPSSTAPAERIPVAAEATPTPTAQTAGPETGTPQDDAEDTSIGRLVYSGFAILAGLAGVGAGVWGLVRYWRRRWADSG